LHNPFLLSLLQQLAMAAPFRNEDAVVNIPTSELSNVTDSKPGKQPISIEPFDTEHSPVNRTASW
jgi:hypothetical protein